MATDLVDAVEEAENAKALGNKKFKEADYAAAADKYTKGAELVDKALTKGKLSGADKKAVDELKEACHLNLANCRLKLKEWDLAITECDKVLAKGENRKARFRRGDALPRAWQAAGGQVRPGRGGEDGPVGCRRPAEAARRPEDARRGG